MSHNSTLQYTEVRSYGIRIHIDCSKENAGAGNSSVITGTLPQPFCEIWEGLMTWLNQSIPRERDVISSKNIKFRAADIKFQD